MSKHTRGGLRGIAAALLVVAPLVALQGTASAAASPTPFASSNAYAAATGTVAHLGGVIAAPNQLVTVEDAYSGATVGPAGLGTAYVNEMNALVQPKLPGTGDLDGNKSYGRGSGAEVGLQQALPTLENQLKLQRVAVSAPASKSKQDEVLSLPANPVIDASVLRGKAEANWNPDGTCILGKPISFGEGYAADTVVVPGATPVASSDPLAADFSRSITQLVPQTSKTGQNLGTALGLLAENRQVIAPVTLFPGTANQLQITVAGQWVLQAVAGGVPGSAFVRYAPEGFSDPSTPVVTVTLGTGATKMTIASVTLQDILGNTGLTIPIPGVATIRIGVPPHKIGDFAKAAVVSPDGTSAAAAVDVVSVTNVVAGLADLRIGHMEATARVPAGGVSCALPVAKTVDKDPVGAGETFTYTITVTNPYDCILTKVHVVDEVTATKGVIWTVISADPTAYKLTDSLVEWNDVGPIAAHSSKDLKILIRVDASTAAGKFTDHAAATALCGSGTANGQTDVIVPLQGETTVTVPTVTADHPPLAHTGTSPVLPFAGLTLVGLGLALARRRATTWI
ncbi:MAG: hypothetical protein QOJ92_1661 [Frankiales bacterium]|nr:hypothetical protein [Frankiales bacterium]